MPVKKRSAAKSVPSEDVTLTITRTEAKELLAMLQQAEALANVVKPGQSQNFLGGLIKKVKRSAGKIAKTAK